MPEPAIDQATCVGHVTSVRGGLVQVRLKEIPTSLVMVAGSAHRIGQIGAFVRIPLGYTQLYGVCTQVGADSEPIGLEPERHFVEEPKQPEAVGFRWMSVVLFGESLEGRFDRGVGQYPTVGDEVHVATQDDLDIIYSVSSKSDDKIEIGRISGSDSIRAALSVSAIVNRHCAVVGSTGSGKSNLVAVLLRSLAASSFSSARILVVDPHGEYSTALASGTSKRIAPSEPEPENQLRVPFWALKFDELMRVAMGRVPDREAEFIRDRIRTMKVEASKHLSDVPPPETITADSPIPFSIRRLWFELEDNERRTYKTRDFVDSELCDKLVEGNPESLVPPEYPSAGLGSSAPFLNPSKRQIGRQLEFMRARMIDSSFSFMFGEDDGFQPDLDGKTDKDLDELLASWIGGDQPITVLDLSEVPTQVLGDIVGSVLALVYDALYWAMHLPVGGKQQPLLIVLDEAHRFLPSDVETAASRVCGRIAREGRKYGVGLMAVTQRPSDISPTVLSQCGTMIALRVTNGTDRSAVSSTVPDDLGGLTALLPSLRTGEGLVLGEALQVPSRVRVDKAPQRPVGDDPDLPDVWLKDRPSSNGYKLAVSGWRSQKAAQTAEQSEDS